MKFKLSRIFLFVFVIDMLFVNVNVLQSQIVQSAKLSLNSKSNFDNGLIANQSLLNTLSTGIDKPLNLIEIDVMINFGTDIDWVFNKQSEIQLSVIQINTSGDTDYRKFPINSFLSPDIISGNYSVQHQGRIISNSNFQVQILNYGQSIRIGSIDIKPDKSTNVFAEIKSFSYSNQAKDQFQATISLVNQYWALNSQVGQLIAEASLNESRSNDQLTELFVFREKLHKSIILLRETMLLIDNTLNGFDPEQLNSKIAVLERLFIRYTTLCNASIEKHVSDEHSTKILIDSYISSLTQYLPIAAKADFRDSDLLVKYSRQYTNSEFTTLLDALSPKSNPTLAAHLLLDGLIQVADSMFDRADFSNALAYYEDARTLSNAYRIDEKTYNLNEKVDNARLGLLQSFLRIASRAVETGNEALANSYKQKSAAFVSGAKQENLIGQLSEESDVLIMTYIRKANEYIDYQRYNEAIHLFETASTSAQNFYNTKFNEQINQGLFTAYRQIYLELVKNAETLLNEGRKADAEFAIRQAENYREDHIVFLRNSTEGNFLKKSILDEGNENSGQKTIIAVQSGQGMVGNGLFDSFVESNSSVEVYDYQTIEAAKEKILEIASSAGIKVWGNALDQAWSMYDEAISLQKKYRLDADTEIHNAFSDLDLMIIERICLNSSFRINDIMKEVKRNIALKKYSDLQTLLDEAISIGTNNQGCEININEAIQLNEYYYQLFQYQKNYDEILFKLLNYGMKSIVESYLNFDSTVSQYQLERFGVEHAPLKRFVELQQNSAYTLQVIDYFIGQINVNESLQYLEILKKQEFTKDQAIEMQQKFAALLAVSDHAHDIKKPELRIDLIVGDDKRLNELKKVYLRSIKQLQKTRPDFFQLFIKT